MADALSRPTTNGIDDVGWTFNGTEAIPQTVTEGVDDTTIRYPWLQPFVKRHTGRVGIALGLTAVFGEGEAVASVSDPVCCPELRSHHWHLSATGCCLQPTPGMLDKVDVGFVAVQMDITCLQAAGF